MLTSDPMMFTALLTGANETAQLIRVRPVPDRRAHAQTGWRKLAGDATCTVLQTCPPAHHRTAGEPSRPPFAMASVDHLATTS